MGVRDEEIKRLEKYAEGLGLRVSWLKNKPNNPAGAEWVVDENLIIIYYSENESKTMLILKLIHELGHQHEYIDSKRKHTKKILEALGKDEPTRKDRIAIYEDEFKASLYHEQIYDTVGLNIPRWKVQVERDIDVLIYKDAIDNPDGMTRVQRREIRKKLIEKYKVK